MIKPKALERTSVSRESQAGQCEWCAEEKQAVMRDEGKVTFIAAITNYPQHNIFKHLALISQLSQKSDTEHPSGIVCLEFHEADSWQG